MANPRCIKVSQMNMKTNLVPDWLKNTISFGLFTFKNVAAGISQAPGQKWYYYPFQTTKEVLVFHQYSQERHFVNPHTSFFNRNCPEDTQERTSVEFRLALFY